MRTDKEINNDIENVSPIYINFQPISLLLEVLLDIRKLLTDIKENTKPWPNTTVYELPKEEGKPTSTHLPDDPNY